MVKWRCAVGKARLAGRVVGGPRGGRATWFVGCVSVFMVGGPRVHDSGWSRTIVRVMHDPCCIHSDCVAHSLSARSPLHCAIGSDTT